jgi:hypothetical protein
MLSVATVLDYEERPAAGGECNDFLDEITEKLGEAETALASGVAPLDAAAVFRRLRETYEY